jgi:hypothetical protein
MARKPGMGSAYEKERARLLSCLVDGQLCPFCRRPMFKAERLSADHFPPRSVAQRTGVAMTLRACHLSCNVRAGQSLGGRVAQARRKRAWVPRTEQQRQAQKAAIVALMRRRKAEREGRWGSPPDPGRWGSPPDPNRW